VYVLMPISAYLPLGLLLIRPWHMLHGSDCRLHVWYCRRWINLAHKTSPNHFKDWSARLHSIRHSSWRPCNTNNQLRSGPSSVPRAG